MNDCPEMLEAFKKIDGHAIDIAAIREKTALHGFRIEAIEKASAEMCKQVQLTEVRIMTAMFAQASQIESLLIQHYKAEGAKNIGKWIPIIIQILVGLTMLYAFLKK